MPTPQATPHALEFSDAAPRLCFMIANGDIPLVDVDDIDYKDVKIGYQDEHVIALDQAVENAIRRAAKNLPNRLKKSSRDMVVVYKDIFQIPLSADPPIDVPPMDIKFEGMECPVKVRQRT